jgi:hypothetical protein
MSKAKKVEAGKLYTNGRAQVVYVADVWGERENPKDGCGEKDCEVWAVQRSGFKGSLIMGHDEVLYDWPYVVDRIVIE